MKKNREHNNHEVANVVFTGQDSSTISIFIFEGSKLVEHFATNDKRKLAIFYEMMANDKFNTEYAKRNT